MFLTPAVAPVTFSDTAHVPLAASVPLDKVAEPAPAAAVAVPPQVLLKLLGVATTRPDGKLSVNVIPVSAVPVFAFEMLKVRDVVPFNGIVDAPKPFVITGGLATLRFADAVLPVPPFVELTLPVTLVY